MNDGIENKDWERADIIYQLKKVGNTKVGNTSISQLSIKNNYSGKTLKNVLFRPYPTAQEILARTIGVAPSLIWPSRYNPAGTPKKNRPAKKHEIILTRKRAC